MTCMILDCSWWDWNKARPCAETANGYSTGQRDGGQIWNLKQLLGCLYKGLFPDLRTQLLDPLPVCICDVSSLDPNPGQHRSQIKAKSWLPQPSVNVILPPCSDVGGLDGRVGIPWAGPCGLQAGCGASRNFVVCQAVIEKTQRLFHDIEKGIISYHDRLRLYLAGGAAFCCKTTTGPNSMLDLFACIVCLFRSVLDPFLAMSQWVVLLGCHGSSFGDSHQMPFAMQALWPRLCREGVVSSSFSLGHRFLCLLWDHGTWENQEHNVFECWWFWSLFWASKLIAWGKCEGFDIFSHRSRVNLCV